MEIIACCFYNKFIALRFNWLYLTKKTKTSSCNAWNWGKMCSYSVLYSFELQLIWVSAPMNEKAPSNLTWHICPRLLQDNRFRVTPAARPRMDRMNFASNFRRFEFFWLPYWARVVIFRVNSNRTRRLAVLILEAFWRFLFLTSKYIKHLCACKNINMSD